MKKIERLEEIRKSINNLYQEKSEIEKDIIKELVELGDKSIPLNDNQNLTLLWIYEKKIDYERLKEKYPNVYKLGLMTTFSSNQALRSMDKNLWEKILQDCLTVNPHYELRKTKKKRKNYERFNKKSTI